MNKFCINKRKGKTQ